MSTLKVHCHGFRKQLYQLAVITCTMYYAHTGVCVNRESVYSHVLLIYGENCDSVLYYIPQSDRVITKQVYTAGELTFDPTSKIWWDALLHSTILVYFVLALAYTLGVGTASAS